MTSHKRLKHPASTPAERIEAGRLTPDQFARIEGQVTYALSPENQTRLALLDALPVDTRPLVESWVRGLTGEARTARLAEYRDAAQRAAALAEGGRARADAGGQRSGAGFETPTSNTGLTGYQPEALTIRLVMSTSGEIVEYPVRRGWGGDAAFVDWITFSFHRDTLSSFATFIQNEDDYILALSPILEHIFGYGVTAKRSAGANFFKASFDLGDMYGLVCIGGQRNKIAVSVSGTGCAAAKAGWEERLVHFLENQAEAPKITRIDLAYDDYEGKLYSVDRGFEDYKTGLYQCYRGNAPECEQIGNWYRPSGKGRTFAIGLRRSGKYCRIYERGKKEGCKESEWVRVECEHKAVGRILPFDMLLQPGAYLAGSYPALQWISETQHRIETVKLQMEIAVEKSLEIIKHQYGKYIGTLVHVFGPEQFLQKVTKEGVPLRLKVPDYKLSPAPLTLTDRHTLPDCDLQTGKPLWQEDIPFSAATTKAPWWINQASQGAH